MSQNRKKTFFNYRRWKGRADSNRCIFGNDIFLSNNRLGSPRWNVHFWNHVYLFYNLFLLLQFDGFWSFWTDLQRAQNHVYLWVSRNEILQNGPISRTYRFLHSEHCLYWNRYLRWALKFSDQNLWSLFIFFHFSAIFGTRNGNWYR